MSHGKRRRGGSGGHPARVDARRRRDERGRAVGASGQADLARSIARTAAGLDSALDAELWASQLVGMFWRARSELPFPDGAELDPGLEYGEPLLRHQTRIDEAGAAIAVLALAEVEDGELGMRARESLDGARLRRRLPAWAADVGESAIVGAAVMRDPVFDDGRTVFLESRHPDGTVLALGVLIDRNLGGLAKDVLLADSIELVEEAMRAHGNEQPVALVLERIEPGVAAGLIREAIETTDMTLAPPVDEDYWKGRALALRADQTRGVVVPDEPTEIPIEDAEALHAEFLASPEGSRFDAEGDGAWVASLAIGFAAHDDPLRWSPTVIELFMADWIPRKVMTTPTMLEVLPEALDAWVRFAGRKRRVPAAALALTRGAIPKFAAEMSERAADPDVGGPTKQLLLAALDAGVDVEDAESLKRFLAGWSPAGELDLTARPDVAPDPPTSGSERDGSIVQVKVSLARATKPPVWRRLQLPVDTHLDDLHHIIQAAFGWYDSHLHVFECGGEQFGPADPELDLDFRDERRFTLAALLAGGGDLIRYTYDFGDDWEHDILLEKRLKPEADLVYPVLVTAKGASPPEDCGGPWGWAHLKDVIVDPNVEEHAEMREWLCLGDDEVLDPTAVDADEIRMRLDALALRVP